MSFGKNVHTQMGIFVSEIDSRQNEVTPDWFKFKNFCFSQ